MKALQPSKVMSAEPNELNEEHPLVLELSSLRETAALFQVLYLSTLIRLTHHLPRVLIADHSCSLA